MSPERIITRTFFPSEFYELCDKGDKSKTQLRSSRRNGGGEYYGKDENWAGTRTWEEAMTLATHGWRKGAEAAISMSEKLSASLVTSLKRPEITFDVTGDMFDIGRVVMDEPECWMTWTDGQEEDGKPVHIVLNCAASAGINTKIIEMRGAAVCALVIALQAGGRPCRVEVAEGIQTRDTQGPCYMEPRVILKDFYEDLQIDALAFALINPAFLRRFCFGIEEHWGITDCGYGMPGDLLGSKGDVYLGQALYGDAQWKNEASAIAWIKTQLELQGVEFR